MAVNVLLLKCAPDGDSYKVRSDRFFFKKLEPRKYPIVIYGDSRTYRGVATPIVAEGLGAPAMNLAFSGSGANAEMFAYLDAHIDYEAQDRFVILGITPWMFTAKARENDHFHEVSRKYAQERASRRSLAGELFAGITPKRVKSSLSPEGSQSWDVEDFREDGWCPTVLARPEEKPEIFKRGLDGYVALFKATQFSKTSMMEFCGRVRDWTDRGVNVIAFRIPSCGEMVELEDSLSGFDENAFKAAAMEAGAAWIDMDVSGYDSYDASHITADAARKMTQDLVKKIANCTKR